MPSVKLSLTPVNLKVAKEFVDANHRHNSSPQGWKFGVGLSLASGRMVGVAIAGRPVSRHLDDGYTMEVTRVCVLPFRNANSMLYGAIIRASRALGYRRVITYTLKSESGSSLKAVGFQEDGPAGGGEWSVPSRPRKKAADVGYRTEEKIRWSITL